MEPPRSEPGALATTTVASPATSPQQLRAQRWKLFRDVAVFQVKLLLDGIKDLVLGPISLVVAAMGLFSKREDPGEPFRALLRWGHEFDQWVNLFGQSEASPRALAATDDPGGTQASAAATPTDRHGIDAHIARMERVLKDQVERGGLTAKAKEAIDNALDRLDDRKPPRS
ncbi:MAG: hypothetical protein K0V04_18190 [Deltaproteobacteria bacterium]|nr:hypothetical protein [Deltaproteobacteria bacterium]